MTLHTGGLKCHVTYYLSYNISIIPYVLQNTVNQSKSYSLIFTLICLPEPLKGNADEKKGHLVYDVYLQS